MDKSISAACVKFAQQAAILSPDGQIVSFARLAELINSFAVRLRAVGVKPGDCVASVVDNSAIRIPLFFALSRLGANVLLGGDVRAAIAATVPVTHVVCLPDQTSDLCKNIIFDHSWMEPQDEVAPYINGAQLIVSSSGTAGRAKFMPIPIAAEMARVAQYNSVIGAPIGRQFLGFGEGSAVGHRFILRAFLGGHGIMFRYKSPAETLSKMRDFGVQEICATPMLLQQFLDAHDDGEKLPEVQKIMLGGGVVSDRLVKRISAKFGCPIDMAIGASEVGTIAGGRINPETYQTGWVGRVVNRSDVQIRDNGALWVRAGAMASGPYFNAVGPFTDGWFSAGDLAHFNDDGELVIDGRETDLINVGGQKLMPDMIEAVAALCPGVRQIAALGIQNSSGFEDVGLVVIADDNFLESALRSVMAETLGEMACVHIRTADTLSYSAANKLDRRAMRALFA